jgi:hypothetical protein
LSDKLPPMRTVMPSPMNPERGIVPSFAPDDLLRTARGRLPQFGGLVVLDRTNPFEVPRTSLQHTSRGLMRLRAPDGSSLLPRGCDSAGRCRLRHRPRLRGPHGYSLRLELRQHPIRRLSDRATPAPRWLSAASMQMSPRWSIGTLIEPPAGPLAS